MLTQPCDCLLACLFVCFSFLVYLASLSVIGGAKSWGEVKKTVKGGFFPVIRVCFRSLSFVPCACFTDILSSLSFSFFLPHAGHVGQLPAGYCVCAEFPLA
jgi:hypothetical protein